ncbi:MAG: hypothetical protein PHS92_05465 [Candidatus Gracilibacteria bacterium]|nr:hypothetical protein [Candidatus Gracilibacteria bacterium]
MKRMILTAIVTVLLAYGVATAAELKDVGTVEDIKVSGATATVVIKNKSGKQLTLKINDPLTVDKFKDHRINTGEEVRVKYDSATGECKLLRKTAGC